MFFFNNHGLFISRGGECGNAENLCHRNHFTFTLRDLGGVSQLTAEGGYKEACRT